MGFPGDASGKESTANSGDTRDMGLISGSGRCFGRGNGNPSSISAWKIPLAEKPGGLQSMGPQRVGHNWATSTFHFSDGHFNILSLKRYFVNKCEEVWACNINYSSFILKTGCAYKYLLLMMTLLSNLWCKHCYMHFIKIYSSHFETLWTFLLVIQNFTDTWKCIFRADQQQQI